jgi:hypothetical protein
MSRQFSVWFVTLGWASAYADTDPEDYFANPTPWDSYESALIELRDRIRLFTGGQVDATGMDLTGMQSVLEDWAIAHGNTDDVVCEITEADICTRTATGWKTLELAALDEQARAATLAAEQESEPKKPKPTKRKKNPDAEGA